MASRSPTYSEAAAELESILAGIEEGKVGIDDLSRKVARAAELIRLCREKLRSTETQVRKIVEEMAAEAAPPPAAGAAGEEPGP